MTLEEALAAALDDEYHARATYRAVLRAYGDVRPFVHIVESEERHIQALRSRASPADWSQRERFPDLGRPP